MPKRIALFVLGVVIAVGAFLLYQLITGQSIGGPVKPHGLPLPPPGNTGIHITEYKSPEGKQAGPGEGKLVYEIMAADPPEQIKDAAGNPQEGRYRLKRVVARWYDDSGRTLEIRGDSCDIQIAPGAMLTNTGGGKERGSESAGGGGGNGLGLGPGDKDVDLSKLHAENYAATLQGHVYMTLSPAANGGGRPAGAGGANGAGSGSTRDLLQSGMRIYFDGPLHMDGSQSLLTTADGFHIRSNLLESDGHGMQLVLNLNSSPKRVEHLLLEDNPEGNRIIIRGGASALPGDATASAKPGGGQAADAGAPLGAPDGAAAAKAGDKVASPAAATNTRPADNSAPPPTYRISFGQNVTAKAKNATLTSDRLYLMLEPTPPRESGEAAAKGPAGNGAAGGAENAAAPAADFPETPAPLAPVRPEDLAVTWSGPMEARPMDPDEAAKLALRGPQDVALDAVGTAENPVTLTQVSTKSTPTPGAPATTLPSTENTILVKAGRLVYSGQGRPITLSPGDGKQVDLKEIVSNLIKPAEGSEQEVTCGEITYTPDAKGNDHAVLAGPGTLVRKKHDEVLTVHWDTRMDADMVPTPGSAKGSSDRVIAEAILQGARVHSVGTDSDLDFAAQTLDVDMANFLVGKEAQQALKSMVARGAVAVNTWKKELPGKMAGPRVIPADRQDKPDGIVADALSILTKQDAGSDVPVLSQMLAEGHVSAWHYTNGSGELGFGNAPAAGPAPAAANAAMVAAVAPANPHAVREWTKNTLITPHLVADLLPRSPAASQPAAGATGAAGEAEATDALGTLAGNVEASHVRADGGVRVLIEPPAGAGARPAVDVTADAMDADPINLSATLTSAKTPGAQPVIASRGKDSIRAAVLNISKGRQNGTDQNILDVPVAGSFEFQARETGKPSQTYLASWSDAMHFDSLAELAVLKGHPVVKVEGNATDLGNLRCDDTLTLHLKPRAKTAEVSAKAPAATQGGGGGATQPAGEAVAENSLDLDWMEAVGNVQASGVKMAPPDKKAAAAGGAALAIAPAQKQIEMFVSASDDPGEPGKRAAVPGRLKYESATQSFEIPGAGALRIIDHRPGNSQGESDFGWKEAMRFDGHANTVTFTRGVDFVFTPVKGFTFASGLEPKAKGKEPATSPAAGEAGVAASAPAPERVYLHADRQLMAQLIAVKKDPGETVSSSPIAFDAAGLDMVTASGNVTVDFDSGDLVLGGVGLTYKMATQVAEIWGTEDNPASADRPSTAEGPGAHVEGDRFILDTTKDKDALTIQRPRGDVSGLKMP